MNSVREKLDKLQWVDRRNVFWTGLTVLIAVTLFALAYYIVYVPGPRRQVSGTVVLFEIHSDGESTQVSQTIHVRLDEGIQVRAAIGPNVVTKVGSRVNLIATKIPIIGIERFRFKELIDTPEERPLLLRK
jgi:hypothetical protein